MTGDDLGIAGPAQRDVAPGAVAVRSGRPVGLTRQKAGPVTGEDRPYQNGQPWLARPICSKAL
jgi:hypothetical protein